jgi:HSP20 family protein
MAVMRFMRPLDTYREIENMSDRLNRLLAERRTPSNEREESISLADWAPAVDVVETETDFQIRAELPGVEKQNVTLSVENGVLTISGRRDQEQEEHGKRYHKVERAYGHFVRSFTVPDVVVQQSVTAEFKNGLLTVRMPKSEKARPKAIEVTVT